MDIVRRAADSKDALAALQQAGTLPVAAGTYFDRFIAERRAPLAAR